MIENILIVDTETTGLSPEKGDTVIEIAAILFNLKFKTILQQYSTLLPCDANAAERINHIKAESTQSKYSTHWMDSVLGGMLEDSQACVAHNAPFDKKFIATLPVIGEGFLKKQWICTKADFQWPVRLSRLRLEDICIAMKVPYTHAHRALSDCSLLAQCFENVFDLEERFSHF